MKCAGTTVDTFGVPEAAGDDQIVLGQIDLTDGEGIEHKVGPEETFPVQEAVASTYFLS